MDMVLGISFLGVLVLGLGTKLLALLASLGVTHSPAGGGGGGGGGGAEAEREGVGAGGGGGGTKEWGTTGCDGNDTVPLTPPAVVGV